MDLGLKHWGEELCLFLVPWRMFLLLEIPCSNSFCLPRDSYCVWADYLSDQIQISKRHLRRYWIWGMAVIILVGIWSWNCKKIIYMKYSPCLIWGSAKYAEFISILFLYNYSICFKSATDLCFYPMLIICLCTCFLLGLQNLFDCWPINPAIFKAWNFWTSAKFKLYSLDAFCQQKKEKP